MAHSRNKYSKFVELCWMATNSFQNVASACPATKEAGFWLSILPKGTFWARVAGNADFTCP